MFKVKEIKTGQIYQVLDVRFVEIFSMTEFLIWKNDKWTWALADEFVPPNYEAK